MKHDARKLDNGKVIKADICIVGAGPAGLTLAHELSSSDLHIVVLESGAEKPSGKADELSRGKLSGVLDQPPHTVHARQIGGTANHWILKMADKRNGYRYAPLENTDFEQRDYIPNSGWPIGRSDLDPYYARLHEKCEVGPYDYSSEYWENENHKALQDGDSVLESGIFSFGATQYFTHDWPAAFEQSEQIDLYTHATVVELMTATDGETVTAAKVRIEPEHEVTFEATQFVIAAGGFDTARLLLLSRDHNPDGLGNQNDVVGRYYMDHGLVLNGYFYPEKPEFMRSLGFYDMRMVDGYSVLGNLKLSEATRREHQLRHAASMIFPKPRDKDQKAFESLQQLSWAVHDRRWPEELHKKIFNLIRGSGYLFHIMKQRFQKGASLMPGLGQGGWLELDDLEKRFSRLELMTLIEMSPQAHNRVTLIDEKDRLGCNLINVHMDWTPEDLDSVKQTEKLMVKQLQAQGFGEYEPHSKDGEIVFYSRTAHHLMGTTRMSDDPKTGVVDKNCKVHGVNNLHIASSAVFATGGFANPTLTILALSIRLADELKAIMSRDPFKEIGSTGASRTGTGG